MIKIYEILESDYECNPSYGLYDSLEKAKKALLEVLKSEEKQTREWEKIYTSSDYIDHRKKNAIECGYEYDNKEINRDLIKSIDIINHDDDDDRLFMHEMIITKNDNTINERSFWIVEREVN